MLQLTPDPFVYLSSQIIPRYFVLPCKCAVCEVRNDMLLQRRRCAILECQMLQMGYIAVREPIAVGCDVEVVYVVVCRICHDGRCVVKDSLSRGRNICGCGGKSCCTMAMYIVGVVRHRLAISWCSGMRASACPRNRYWQTRLCA